MKKIISKISTSIIVVVLSLSLSGCIGSFGLWHKVLDWNEGASDSKFVNELIFLGLTIIPVYPLAFLGDVLIFNSIEFWGGTNPVAMGADEVEESEIMHEGTKYKMIKKQNSLTLANGDVKVDFKYFPEEEAWYLMDGSEKVKVAELKDDAVFTYLPNDKTLVFNQSMVDQIGSEVMAARD